MRSQAGKGFELGRSVPATRAQLQYRGSGVRTDPTLPRGRPV